MQTKEVIVDLAQIVPPKYVGIVVTMLACIKILDEIVRLIPDRFIAAHTTVQAITNGIKWLAAKATTVKVNE